MFQVLCVNKQSCNKSTFCYHVFLWTKASFKNAEIINKKTTQHTIFGIEENKFASENSPHLKSGNKKKHLLKKCGLWWNEVEQKIIQKLFYSEFISCLEYSLTLTLEWTKIHLYICRGSFRKSESHWKTYWTENAKSNIPRF